ncbi:hypothetical protein EDD18DRAFT_1098820 [Armillaria luteobubalina]|uniref:Uncharacterized protein n=1 Tax=Armillaria luteobubalina TaxID=153913 RepID=A0AA39QPI8_9AGAR|nr:hypothetical protein EDD18DRAFT_1098820 [Armillaria luteobubalina]
MLNFSLLSFIWSQLSSALLVVLCANVFLVLHQGTQVHHNKGAFHYYNQQANTVWGDEKETKTLATMGATDSQYKPLPVQVTSVGSGAWMYANNADEKSIYYWWAPQSESQFLSGSLKFAVHISNLGFQWLPYVVVGPEVYVVPKQVPGPSSSLIILVLSLFRGSHLNTLRDQNLNSGSRPMNDRTKTGVEQKFMQLKYQNL